MPVPAGSDYREIGFTNKTHRRERPLLGEVIQITRQMNARFCRGVYLANNLFKPHLVRGENSWLPTCSQLVRRGALVIHFTVRTYVFQSVPGGGQLLKFFVQIGDTRKL